jgi:hypothetical protein
MFSVGFKRPMKNWFNWELSNPRQTSWFWGKIALPPPPKIACLIFLPEKRELVSDEKVMPSEK